MQKFNFKTISYNLARNNYPARAKTDHTKWDSIDGKRMIEAFSVAAKEGFTMELLNDLLSPKEYKRFVARFKALEELFMGTPYSYISESTNLSSKTIADISKKTADKQGGYYRVMRDHYPRGFRYFE